MGKSLLDSGFFNDAFQQFHPGWSDAFSQGSRGSYELVESENGETADLYVAVPGYMADDLSVEMNAGRLSIRGQPAFEEPKTVLVPNKIDLHFTVSPKYLIEEATIVNGLLRIKLTGQNSKTEAIKIPIKSL